MLELEAVIVKTIPLTMTYLVWHMYWRQDRWTGLRNVADDNSTYPWAPTALGSEPESGSKEGDSKEPASPSRYVLR